MKSWSFTLAIGLLTIALAAPAHATKVLYTAPALDFFSGGEKLFCNVVNAGTSTVDVTIEAHYDDGTLQAMGSLPLAPGHYNVLTAQNLASAYCRFVIQGPARGIRAEAVYIDLQTGERTVTVPAR